MLPHTITYPIMGMSIQDIRSPQFIISLCAEIAYIWSLQQFTHYIAKRIRQTNKWMWTAICTV